MNQLVLMKSASTNELKFTSLVTYTKSFFFASLIHRLCQFHHIDRNPRIWK